MGYQALLFCPDEKTARTVTQVLSELEFSVEACSEPFAAVKKLMGEHFDAVVVDCDNEQNATLLFKSARNSTSNQTSLAVAVVEGQAGVAKAFRIGANLVLTKPINIEQAKGTLRVARGLLRKADPAKPAAPAAAPSQTAAQVPTPKAPAKPTLVTKPAAPVATPKAVAPEAKEVPAVSQPAAPAWPAAPTAQASDLVEKVEQKVSSAPPVVVPDPVKPKDVPAPEISSPAAVKAVSTPSFSIGGAASAPAPAREAQTAKISEPEFEKAVEAVHEKAVQVASPESGTVGAAPTFSFGGANLDSQESGGNKKIFLGIAAALIVSAAAYFGWSHFKTAGSANTATPAAVELTSATTAPVSKPSVQPAQPGPAARPNISSENAVGGSPENSRSNEAESAPKENLTHGSSTAKPAASTSAPAKAEPEEKPEPAPLMVKGGKVSAAHSKAAAASDAPAPSLIGMATPAAAPPPDLVPSTTSAFKPVLQTLSVSQGVSQGLLYKKVAPIYPPSALRMHIEGKVELMATISKTGDISQVKVLSGDAQLSGAAKTAVKQWKYKPYLLNGEPVEIQTEVTVNFKLPN